MPHLADAMPQVCPSPALAPSCLGYSIRHLPSSIPCSSNSRTIAVVVLVFKSFISFSLHLSDFFSYIHTTCPCGHDAGGGLAHGPCSTQSLGHDAVATLGNMALVPVMVHGVQLSNSSVDIFSVLPVS